MVGATSNKTLQNKHLSNVKNVWNLDSFLYRQLSKGDTFPIHGHLFNFDISLIWTLLLHKTSPVLTHLQHGHVSNVNVFQNGHVSNLDTFLN